VAGKKRIVSEYWARRIRELLGKEVPFDEWIAQIRLVELILGKTGLTQKSREVAAFNADRRLRNGWHSLLEDDFEIERDHRPGPRGGHHRQLNLKFKPRAKEGKTNETESHHTPDWEALPTCLPDYVSRAYTESERAQSRKKRSNIMHRGIVKIGGRSTEIEVSDRVVEEAEYGIKEPGAVVWAQKPSMRDQWAHQVRTQRTITTVLERRSPKGKTLDMWTNGGRYTTMNPNGAILKCLLLRGMFEFTHRPSKEKVKPSGERVLTDQEKQEAKRTTRTHTEARQSQAAREADLPIGRQAHLILTHQGDRLELYIDQHAAVTIADHFIENKPIEKAPKADGQKRIDPIKAADAFEKLSKTLDAGKVPVPMLVMAGAIRTPPLKFTDPDYYLYRDAFYNNQEWIQELDSRGIKITDGLATYPGGELPKRRYKHYWRIA